MVQQHKYTKTNQTGEVESLLPEESYSPGHKKRNQNYGMAKTTFDNG